MADAPVTLGGRLRQLRLARGLSLDDLVAAIDGAVSKQTLSKYERDLSVPAEATLDTLASALGVSVERLHSAPRVDLIQFRKTSKLSAREGDRIEQLVTFALEERQRIALSVGAVPIRLPYLLYDVRDINGAEEAAGQLRNDWRLGTDPIYNLVSVLEAHGVHVIELESEGAFDGVSAVARPRDDAPASALAVVGKRGIPGGRQRFTLAHELGHLVMRVPDFLGRKDEEKLAHRFASAFLAPAESIRRDAGRRRRFISAQELLHLKERYGMSVQAILYRLKDLGVINAESYKKWCIIINRNGWRKNEPARILPEVSTWLERHVLQAVGEGVMAKEEAQRVLSVEMDGDQTRIIMDRADFRSMGTDESARFVREQMDQAIKVRRSQLPDWWYDEP